MIKVIEFIGALKDGGAETLVKEYVTLIDKQKYNVSILTIYPMKNTANYCQVSKIGVDVFSVYPRYSIFFRVIHKLFGTWYIPFRLKQIIKREKPDCIHINSPVASFVAAISPKVKNTKLIYTCHSEPKKYFISANKHEEKAVRKLICNNNMQLIALHDDMRIELNKLFSVKNTIVINNGVNFSQYRRMEWDINRIRDSIGIPHNAFLVVHVGRFAAVKNHSFLLEVFSEIKKEKKNAQLLLVGDGPLRKTIAEEIRQKDLSKDVTILSHRTDVPQLLYASNLMIFPSKYEGLSVTLVEAQVTGLRCLVSDSVNKANFLTENTIPVSLKTSANEWAKVALDDRVKNTDVGDLGQFDLAKEICKLEFIYSQ